MDHVSRKHSSPKMAGRTHTRKTALALAAVILPVATGFAYHCFTLVMFSDQLIVEVSSTVLLPPCVGRSRPSNRSPSVHEKISEFAQALSLEFLSWNEPERCTVDAISKTRWSRSVLENVP